MSGEADERFPVGPQGAKGEQGAQGERGLSRLQGRAIVVLFLIGALGGTVNLFWTARTVHAYQAAQSQEQAAQQRQGALVEQRLCTTLGRLAANKPPAGNAASNPSRAWEQQQHTILAQLGGDVGCRR